MFLSKEAIDSLRLEITTIYSKELADSLSDQDLDEIGAFLLTILAEGLKTKMSQKESIKTTYKPTCG